MYLQVISTKKKKYGCNDNDKYLTNNRLHPDIINFLKPHSLKKPAQSDLQFILFMVYFFAQWKHLDESIPG